MRSLRVGTEDPILLLSSFSTAVAQGHLCSAVTSCSCKASLLASAFRSSLSNRPLMGVSVAFVSPYVDTGVTCASNA